MKLGSQTGSLINHIQSRAVIGQPEATVGMGVTLLLWTDRSPGTILTVSPDGQWITVQDDRAIFVCGSAHDGSAEYTFEPDPAGSINTFKKQESGMWQHMVKNRATSRWNKSKGGPGLRIGERNKYYDPSF